MLATPTARTGTPAVSAAELNASKALRHSTSASVWVPCGPTSHVVGARPVPSTAPSSP